jgi:hypothetical protein
MGFKQNHKINQVTEKGEDFKVYWNNFGGIRFNDLG